MAFTLAYRTFTGAMAVMVASAGPLSAQGSNPWAGAPQAPARPVYYSASAPVPVATLSQTPAKYAPPDLERRLSAPAPRPQTTPLTTPPARPDALLQPVAGAQRPYGAMPYGGFAPDGGFGAVPAGYGALPDGRYFPPFGGYGTGVPAGFGQPFGYGGYPQPYGGNIPSGNSPFFSSFPFGF